MRIYISSGNGVDEVCRALWYFLRWIETRYRFNILKLESARRDEGYRSIVLESDDAGLLSLTGTHLWRCQSPFRPKHKRKNWYFTLSVDCAGEEVSIDRTKVIYQTMKSPKKGGQHVNTTNSGVRARYMPLGLAAISYDERSQHRNKEIALARLIQKAQNLVASQNTEAQQRQWKQGKQVERGNAVKVFEGTSFQEVR